MLRFGCAVQRGRINNLSVEFDLPDAMALGPVFDVLPFEGPDGAGAASLLEAVVGDAKQEVRFFASGWFGGNGGPANSFTFGRAFTAEDRGALPRLQAVAELLTHGAGRLSWTVQNGARREAPLLAVFELNEADAASLRAAVAPCLPHGSR
ncbi:MAG: hypothetical protein JOZ05_05000 [Acetobacteraceae bacterium]|nr:hypothetical protein [Acetobacteraceae bacterium]